jgi:deoxyribodipyrimidine photo-lyase
LAALLARQWKPGVEGALEKLETFLSSSLPAFEHDRAKVDRGSTSQLSPWIHIGTISVRYIFYRVGVKPQHAG